jgi:hypothetical protein
MANVIQFHKTIGSLPSELVANALYAVRAGEGIDMYVTDVTGNAAHKVNTGGVVDPKSPLLGYTDGKLTSVMYDDGSVKTLVYTDDKLMEVRYNTGIVTEVKTLVYTGDTLIEVIETTE